MIHPAENLTDGHRYIVALRHLVTDNGTVATPPAAFKAYRDGTAPATDPRRAHMDNLFATLAKAGVGRSNLYLAWDFTTASTKNVTGRLLAIRNDAFAQLQDPNLSDGVVQGIAPAFTVDKVVEPTQWDNIARQITGHFTVPCYLAPTCEPPAKCDQVSQGTFNDCPTPGQFALDPTNPDAVPSQTPGQTYQANFICNVGKTAYAAGYTGLGVGAARFGARVALDLLDGRETEATQLRYVRTKPVPFPPEPLRSAVIQLTRNRLAAADRRQGRRGLWLRGLDRLGLGFDS